MKPEEQRIAIAKAVGGKTYPSHSWDERDDRRYFICERCKDRIGWGDYSNKRGTFAEPCSGDDRNFPDDLNAMHDAELAMTDEQAVRFRLLLQNNSDGPDAEFPTVEAAMCHATAAQRAEAFLKTLNLWTTHPTKGPK